MLNLVYSEGGLRSTSLTLSPDGAISSGKTKSRQRALETPEMQKLPDMGKYASSCLTGLHSVSLLGILPSL